MDGRQLHTIASIYIYTNSAHIEDLSIVTTDDNRSEDCLYCPKRPKWKYYMTKKEVEKVGEIRVVVVST